MFAYMAKQAVNPLFRSKEDVVSMFLGLVVVVAVVGFLVNFIEKRKGNIEVPGVSNYVKIEETTKTEVLENTETSQSEVIVKKNDSLWKIAVRVYGDGYKWTEIAKANNLKNPGVLLVGQKLVLPKLETAKIADGKGVVSLEKTEYVVLRGDTLWGIATKMYSDGYKWTKIWQDNRSKLNSPDRLEIGMTLVIYGKI